MKARTSNPAIIISPAVILNAEEIHLLKIADSIQLASKKKTETLFLPTN